MLPPLREHTITTKPFVVFLRAAAGFAVVAPVSCKHNSDALATEAFKAKELRNKKVAPRLVHHPSATESAQLECHAMACVRPISFDSLQINGQGSLCVFSKSNLS